MAKDKLPWFPLWVNDWLSSTTITLMTPAQEGAYIRLLCHQWASPDCSLPADDAALAALSRLGNEWEQCSSFVRVLFDVCSRDSTRIRNSRLYEVWLEQRELIAARSEAGRKSGQARRLRNKQNSNKTRTKREQSESESDSNTESYTEPVSNSDSYRGDVNSVMASASADACRAGLDVSDVQAVINHYRTYHPKARPGEKERRLIRARLKDRYTVQELCDAIDGNHLSPWHCGENDDGREYHAIGLILRNADKVTQFIACKENPRDAVTSLNTKRTAAAAESYLEKRKAIDGIF